jgi:hypothetical protein
MKSIIFWDMTPCSPLSFNRRFRGTYRLHLQGRRNRFSKPASKLRNVGWNYGLHGVISQKMILFITTSVKTSNPKYCWLIDIQTTCSPLKCPCSILYIPWSSNIYYHGYLHNCYCFDCELGYLGRLSDGLWTERPGLIPVRDKTFLSSPQRPDRLWDLPSLLSNGYRGPFPRG